MSRVVPSQVVAFIDAFPALDGRREIDRAYLFGLADLLTEIPSQLLIMDPPTHASFICSRARVRETVSAWNAAASAGSNARGYISPATESAIQGIRAGLARCPDESPTTAMRALTFITDPDLRTSLHKDIGAIDQALSNGEWKAANVLAGSAIEALLLWKLQQRPSVDIINTIAALRGSGELTRQPDPNLERWDLHEFTEVAAHLGIIKPDTATETRLAREFRNLIHPGRAQRLAQNCDRGTALSCVAALEHVVRDLT